MTTQQQELIDALAARKIDATWDGNALQCKTAITRVNGRKQWQRFAVVFDSAATLEGPRVLPTKRGTYGDLFARDAFYESIRIGQGAGEAAKYVAECKEAGVYSGCK